MFSATKGAKWGRKRSDGVEYVIDIAVWMAYYSYKGLHSPYGFEL